MLQKQTPQNLSLTKVVTTIFKEQIICSRYSNVGSLCCSVKMDKIEWSLKFFRILYV